MWVACITMSLLVLGCLPVDADGNLEIMDHDIEEDPRNKANDVADVDHFVADRSEEEVAMDEIYNRPDVPVPNMIFSERKRKKGSKCKPTNMCKNHGGVCKESCSRSEEESHGGCKGRNCMCCRPKGPKCQPTNMCKNHGGRCKDICGKSEIMSHADCMGRHCICCKPKGTKCKKKNKCRRNGGICKESCDKSETNIPKGCKGRKCECCKPKDQKCKREKKCRRNGGVCKELCNKSEINIPKGCKGRTCKCCKPKGPKCEPKQMCKKHKGICKESCSKSEENIPGGCMGKNCMCCKPKDIAPKCRREKKCKKNGGVCKAKCNSSEEEIHKGCRPGSKCKCCKSDPPCHEDGGEIMNRICKDMVGESHVYKACVCKDGFVGKLCEHDCNKKYCTKIMRPVCGADASTGKEITFNNKCLFFNSMCNKEYAGLYFLYDGRCQDEDLCGHIHCPQDCGVAYYDDPDKPGCKKCKCNPTTPCG